MRTYTSREWSLLYDKNITKFKGLHKSQRTSGAYIREFSDLSKNIHLFFDPILAVREAARWHIPFLSFCDGRMIVATDGRLLRKVSIQCLHNMEAIQIISSHILRDSESMNPKQSDVVLYCGSRSDIAALQTGGFFSLMDKVPDGDGISISEADLNQHISRHLLPATRPLVVHATIPYDYARWIDNPKELLGVRCNLSIYVIPEEAGDRFSDTSVITARNGVKSGVRQGIFIGIEGVSPRLERIGSFYRSGPECGMLSKQDASDLVAWSGHVESSFSGKDEEGRFTIHTMTTLAQNVSDIVTRLKV